MQAIHNQAEIFGEWYYGCFKEQRYKINASNSQQRAVGDDKVVRCFKEQRYKINASNSQRKRI